MRKAPIAIMFFFIVMLFDLRPAPAADAAPWCAVLSMGHGAAYWDCQYATFEACRPTVLAGNRGFCNQNPRFEGWWRPQEPAPRHIKRRARHG